MTRVSQVRPGFHPAFYLPEFHALERPVLLSLASEFYLTNPGRTVHLGKNAEYRYFLLKAKDEYAEEFNIKREIICVFSRYENFEPRTLDAFDAAIKEFQALRIDNICRVLISQDKEIDAKLQELIKADPEQAVIVPFLFDELRVKRPATFYKERFRKQLYTRNLFDFYSPLQKDLYFFGRSATIQRLIARYESSENSGLFGLRRSGKTSVIYGVERAMAARGKRTVTIDCQSPSVHQLRWNELLHKVVSDIHLAKDSKSKLHSRDAYTVQDAATLFDQEMMKVHSSKKAEPVLLIFDEIERISPKTAASNHWKVDNDFVYFWQAIRAFFQRNRGVFTFLLVGTNPSCIESTTINGNDNPIFGFLPHNYLPPFDTEQIQEMVSQLGKYMGLSFDPMLFGLLANDYGGHPFLIRQVCSEIHSSAPVARPIKVEKPLYERASAQFREKSEPYIGMILDVLSEQYPDEYEMLRYLAAGDVAAFHSLAQVSSSYTDHLKGYGVISADATGATFRIESVKEFMQKRHSYTSLVLSPEQRNAEANERRTRLEQRLRKIAKTQLKAAFGKQKALEKVLSAIPEKRRIQLAGADIDALLSTDKSPLFLLEIVQVISREWDIFQNILSMEKQKVIFMLEEINKLRRDAHANSISLDELRELRVYFSKFETTLAEWE